MKHYIVYFRDSREPKEVFSLPPVVQGKTHVFYNQSGYAVEQFPMYLVESIVEVE